MSMPRDNNRKRTTGRILREQDFDETLDRLQSQEVLVANLRTRMERLEAVL
jgi:hypothetical protein